MDEMHEQPKPPLRAEGWGHHLVWDPPAALTAARRWTCDDPRCGATVIDYRGNVYGSAVEKTHEEMIQYNRERGLV